MSSLSFSIPCYFNIKALSSLLKCLEGHTAVGVIDETYGCLSHSIIGHGRSSSAVAQVKTLDEVRSYRDFCKNKGLRFNYLLNAPYSDSRVSEHEAVHHIGDILSVVEPDSVTISSLRIGRIVRHISSDIPITISTIAGIRRPEDLVPYLEIHPTTIVPHNDLGRTLDSLSELTQYAWSFHIEIRLLVNESCLFSCPTRQLHYEYLATGEKDDLFQRWCNQMKYGDPALLLESGWIRPEDVLWLSSNYQIRQFKISGRAKGAAWLPEVANAYVRGAYSGNLMRLLATTPPDAREPWADIFIDNGSLQDFLPNLPSGASGKRRSYCQEWARYLQEEGMMSMAETIPKVTRDHLCAC